MIFKTPKQRMSSNGTVPPCLIMDDDELAEDQTTTGWRRNGEELKNTRVFGIDTAAHFPSAFQTYRPDQARSFPFQIGKRAKKAEESEELLAEQQKSKEARAAFYNSEKAEQEYSYSERTPTATPQPELVRPDEEVSKD